MVATSYLRQRPPVWYWLVAVALLLWGAMGCYACYQQIKLGAEAIPGGATDYDRQLFATLPGWYNYVYALAVGGGFVGAAALLIRSVFARTFFALSLAGIVVQFGYVFVMTDLIAQKGAAATLPFPIFIAAVAVFAIWFCGHAQRRGWIS